MWTNKILSYLDLPEDIADQPFRRKWNSPYVLSKEGSFTKIDEALCFIHGSGLLLILSGTLTWAAARLEKQTNTTEATELAEALFAYQVSNDYFNRERKIFTPDYFDQGNQFDLTIDYLVNIFIEGQIFRNDNWPLYPTFEIVKEAIFLTRHHLPKALQEEFDEWIRGIIERSRSLVPFDDQDKLPINPQKEEMESQRKWVMGRPLPPQALDLNMKLDEKALDSQVQEFLLNVDWKKNRFLREPDQIAKNTKLKSVYGVDL